MAPITSPLKMIGTPPCRNVCPTVINACLPPLIEFSSLDEGALKVAAVFAFLMETSAAAAKVPSMRSK
jgi:hypothetical protein